MPVINIFRSSHARLYGRSLLIIQQRRNAGIFKSFIDNVKKEVNTDEELKNDVKKIEEKLTDFRDSKVVGTVKDAFSSAKKELVNQNQALFSELDKGVRKVGQRVSEGAEKVTDVYSQVAEPVNKLGRRLKPAGKRSAELISKAGSKIIESPIVSQVSKNITNVRQTLVDDSESLRYGGFLSKEMRDKIREERLKQAEAENATSAKEDPNAGSNVVTHRGYAWRQKWEDFKDNNPVYRSLFDVKRTYDESNNIFIYYSRILTNAIGDTWSTLFRESETARVVKEIARIDPTFNLEKFLKDSREYIIPEILEAFLAADLKSLRPWCDEGVYNLLKANIEIVKKPGISLHGKIYDMRYVDLVDAKIVDDRPVLIISFHTQQTNYARDLSGAVVDGKEDYVQSMYYRWALAKLEESNPLTGGWRLVEMAMRPGSGF